MVPMKSSCKNKQIVHRNFIERGVEVTVIDQSTSFIDDDQRVDHPFADQKHPCAKQSSTHIIYSNWRNYDSDVRPLGLSSTHSLLMRLFHSIIEQTDVASAVV